VGVVSVKDRVMERTWVYRAWQAPFAERKFAPVQRHNDLSRVARVLDVGCGPGTNATHFAASDYVGVDVNPDYVEDARRRHPGEFIVADASHLEGRVEGTFDFVLVNSLLHHLDDATVERTLTGLVPLTAPDGFVHVLELCRPSGAGIARALARADRGAFPRPLAEWRELLESVLEPVVVEPYPLGIARVTFWEMVYFKGAPISERPSS